MGIHPWSVAAALPPLEACVQAWLSDELLQAVAEWLMALERAGGWHSQASTALVHLYTEGGRWETLHRHPGDGGTVMGAGSKACHDGVETGS